MIKFFFKIIKNIIFSILLLYSYNVMIAPLNLNIPINLITISGITVFGLPALLSFIIILIIAF